MTREHFTAWLWLIVTVGMWAYGFHQPVLHTFLSGFAVIMIGCFPLWIVKTKADDE